jgi:predicted ATPase
MTIRAASPRPYGSATLRRMKAAPSDVERSPVPPYPGPGLLAPPRDAMYKSLTIKHFRGIEELAIANLSRVNLVVGRNNTGKTSVLEALLLLGGSSNASPATRLGVLRGQSDADPRGIWVGLFGRQDASVPIEITGRNNLGERHLRITASTGAVSEDGVLRAVEQEQIVGIEMTFERGDAPYSLHAAVGPDGMVRYPVRRADDGTPTTFLPAHGQPALASQAARLSHLVKAKREREVTEAVRLVDPRITRLVVGTEAGGATVFADVGLPSLLPLALSGQGTVRLFSWAVEVPELRGGVLLLDEIDDGLHHTIMVDVLRALGTMAEDHDVQIFATTHNDELIRAALEAFSTKPEQLRIVRIGRKDDRSTAAVYDEQSLPAIANANLEVRG